MERSKFSLEAESAVLWKSSNSVCGQVLKNRIKKVKEILSRSSSTVIPTSRVKHGNEDSHSHRDEEKTEARCTVYWKIIAETHRYEGLETLET